jgi:choline dehydrogenase-like flavoprotein
VAEERTDVLVIGSGAAGAAVTKRLTDLGANVVCLEQGNWVKPGEYPSTFSQSFRPDRQAYTTSPNDRKRHEDYPVTTAGANPPQVDMFNAVGGTTIHWAGCFPRFHPSDFRVKTLDSVADDWPISYRDLEPYYDMNDREMGVSGLAGDPANPPRSTRPTPPLPLDAAGKIIARGYDKLGWHWWPCDNAIISRRYDGRPGCQLGSAAGCPPASRASTDLTYWPKALAHGAVLKTGARVREITLDEHSRVRGVLYHDSQGTVHEQRARVVVVCCNGIGTPRLLLNSKSKVFPDGIANSSGMVGRNFMTHLWRFLTGTFQETLDMHEELLLFTGIPIFSQQFYETDPQRVPPGA